jgi:hypothetical protein
MSPLPPNLFMREFLRLVQTINSLELISWYLFGIYECVPPQCFKFDIFRCRFEWANLTSLKKVHTISFSTLLSSYALYSFSKLFSFGLYNPNCFVFFYLRFLDYTIGKQLKPIIRIKIEPLLDYKHSSL